MRTRAEWETSNAGAHFGRRRWSWPKDREERRALMGDKMRWDGMGCTTKRSAVDPLLALDTFMYTVVVVD